MTSLTLDRDRAELLRRLESNDPYGFLDRVVRYLDQSPVDHSLRLAAVREYVRLGLGGPANELLIDVDAGDDRRVATALEALRGEMAAVPVGRIAWSAFRNQFEANLAVLNDRGLDAGAIRDAWRRDGRRYQLFRDAAGRHHVRAHDDAWRWRWIPYFGDHPGSAERQAFPDDVQQLTPGPYLFDGVALGHLFARIYQRTLDTFHGYSCALFVIEPEPAVLALALHLHDWYSLLSDERVRLFVGPEWKTQLEQAWDGDPDLPFPTRAFAMGQCRAGEHEPALVVVERAGQLRNDAVTASAIELNARYDARDVAWWARRFHDALHGDGPPLRILAAVSTHTTFLQYSMRDVRDALHALGHQCTVLTESTDHAISGPLTYHRAMQSLDPDLFFVFDHVRPEFRNVLPRNLPVLTWDQDCLPQVFTRQNLDGVARHDFLVGCSRARWVEMGYDPAQYLTCAIPTSADRFAEQPLTDAERERYGCDVSYVSHASQTADEFHAEQRAQQKNPDAVRMMDAMHAILPNWPNRPHVSLGVLTAEVLGEACRRCKLEIHDPAMRNWLLEWYLWRLGDRLFRHEALQWVADWARRTGRSFRIYGNGWDRHATLSVFAAGPVENGNELSCVNRASRINLQLMPAGMIHQRALDGLACGGFFLARSTHEGSAATLRQLMARIEALGIRDSAALLANDDVSLRRLLTEYLGDWLRPAKHHGRDALAYLRHCAEVDHAGDVFHDLDAIQFNSADEFEPRVEHFLNHDDERRDITERMRRVVLERFSYRSTVDRFLHAMADYLAARVV